jgi:type II restriction-modification system restriction subunit
MESLLNFLHDESISSPFRAELSNRGGYITFSNSGRRGDTKYFQIGIDSILTTLKDILNNITVFSRIQDYDEKPWRDNGSIYFSDPVANANSTVQTKPLFSTLSKIIKWANQPILNNLNSDNRISITPDSLENAINNLNAVADSYIPHSNSKIVKSPLDEPTQVIYYGAPGTGKSFTIDDKTDDVNSVRTTFHPDSDYASFVGAYKPTMENVPINSIYGESVQFATGKNGHPGTEKKIVYKYVPQAFLKAYVAAWSNLDTPYFLIIEEINRGNCAQIFGDLFQLLDRNNAGSSSYAIHADEDITQFLSDDDKGFASLSDDQKDAIRAFVLHKDNGKTQAIGQDILNGTLLLLPPNLYIWATMNTSDQSLFPIDSAFKRRWNWKYMPIEYHPIDKKTQQPIDWKFQIGDNIYSWGQFLSKINPEIYTLTESSDKQMGYFFAKADNATGIISEDVFLNKVLFYLWTDVFKDFDVSSELFKNKKANRSFRFTDFFEDPEALGNFIDNFNLDVVEDFEHVGEIQNEKGEWVQPTFMVDGEKISSMIDTVLTVLKKYFEKYPDISTEEAIQVWNSFGLPKHALETEQIFDERTDMSKNRASKVFNTADGRKFYVSSQLRKQHMDKLISKANDWDIHITRLS